jgi:long-chain acyl-CoA synthetase
MIKDYTVLPLDAFAKFAKEQPNNIYLRQPIDGHYNETTWAEAYQKMLRLAAGYRSLGLEVGDKVAILSENCAEWFISDFALTAAGLISVPIYFTAGEKTISYVLEHSEAKAIVVGKLGDASAAKAAIPDDFLSIGMPYDSVPCKVQLTQLIDDNEPLVDLHKPQVDDMFSITYTSGSTGNPKGVVLTFRNIVFGANSMDDTVDKPDKESVISYLPLAHITERALIQYASLYNGGMVTFNESLATFVRDLKSANVTAFLSVPRLWMKFQAGVLAKMPQKKLDRLLKIPVLRGLVKKKIKEQLGLSNTRICGSGSAPIAPSILEWYQKLGIEIAEGWGMTELTGMATSQFPFRADKLGTIGKTVDGLQIKISDEGEILIRGDAVFKEYYKDPATTAETFTEDGWMLTGDRASIDTDGYFRITGRVKELFKSGKGKYVAPVPIESLMVQNQLIDQICVMGSGLAKPMAVLVLAPETSAGLSREAISASLAETLDLVNQQLEKHECLGGLCIAKETWAVENGMLTPTLKIKRDVLEGKYQGLITHESGEKVIWE